MSKDSNTVHDACIAAPTPAAFARALGRPGKSVRDVLRGRFGVYVSHTPEAWDARTREALYAFLTAPDAVTRKGIVDAYKADAGA